MAFVGSQGSANNVKAYLNVLVFDQDFNYVPSGAFYTQVRNSSGYASLSKTVNLSQGGYVYVYLSNESKADFNVYFDDLNIVHTKGEILQEDHYYPFGMNISALSSTAPKSKPNKINTFQGQEKVDDFDLNWIQFKWRNHDPQIGRFFNVDPLADQYVHNSPYAFSENQVTVHVELEGLEKISIKKTKAAQKTEAMLIAMESSPTTGGAGYLAGLARNFFFGGANMIEGAYEYAGNEISHQRYQNNPNEAYPSDVEKRNYQQNKLGTLTKSIKGGADYLSAATEAQSFLMGGIEGSMGSSAGKQGIKLATGADFVDNLISNPASASFRSADDIAKQFTTAGYDATVTSMKSGRGQMVTIGGHSNISTIKVHPGGGRHTLSRVQISGQAGGDRFSIKVVQGSESRYTGDIAAEKANGTRFVFQDN